MSDLVSSEDIAIPLRTRSVEECATMIARIASHMLTILGASTSTISTTTTRKEVLERLTFNDLFPLWIKMKAFMNKTNELPVHKRFSPTARCCDNNYSFPFKGSHGDTNGLMKVLRLHSGSSWNNDFDRAMICFSEPSEQTFIPNAESSMLSATNRHKLKRIHEWFQSEVLSSTLQLVGTTHHNPETCSATDFGHSDEVLKNVLDFLRLKPHLIQNVPVHQTMMASLAKDDCYTPLHKKLHVPQAVYMFYNPNLYLKEYSNVAKKIVKELYGALGKEDRDVLLTEIPFVGDIDFADYISRSLLRILNVRCSMVRDVESQKKTLKEFSARFVSNKGKIKSHLEIGEMVYETVKGKIDKTLGHSSSFLQKESNDSKKRKVLKRQCEKLKRIRKEALSVLTELKNYASQSFDLKPTNEKVEQAYYALMVSGSPIMKSYHDLRHNLEISLTMSVDDAVSKYMTMESIYCVVMKKLIIDDFIVYGDIATMEEVNHEFKVDGLAKRDPIRPRPVDEMEDIMIASATTVTEMEKLIGKSNDLRNKMLEVHTSVTNLLK